MKLNLKDEAAVRQAFNEIKTSVANHAKSGASHFQGVTVQPFAKFEGTKSSSARARTASLAR